MNSAKSVAFPPFRAPLHNNHFFDLIRSFGIVLEKESDIGQGTEGDDLHLTGMGIDLVDKKLNGGSAAEFSLCREVYSTQAVVAMDMVGMVGGSAQRLACTGGHLDIQPCQLCEGQGHSPLYFQQGHFQKPP